MPELTHPDVFFLEKGVGPQPIQLAGTSAAAFIGTAEKGPINDVTFVSSFEDYTETFGNDFSVGYLTRAVQRYFSSGGSRAWIVRTSHYTTEGDEDDYTAEPAKLTIQSSEATPTDIMDVSANTPGTWANDWDVIIENVTNEDQIEFDLRVVDEDGDTQEQWQDLNFDETDDQNYVETAINVGARNAIRRTGDPSDYITVTVNETTKEPAELTYDFGEGTNGQDGTNGTESISDEDYVGNSAAGTGFYALNSVPEMLNICVPGVTTQTVHNAGINYAKNNPNRGGPYGWDFYVADLPVGLEPQGAMEHLRDNLNTNSWEGIYYPWVKRSGNVEPVAPYMCGIIALSDSQYGPWRAPAGTNWPLAIDEPLFDVTNSDQDILNPHGINAIRQLEFTGSVAWGARTARTGTKWQYVSTRRFFNFIKKSLYDGMDWTIFEMNGPNLWKRVEQSLDSFMSTVWSMGAFGGYTKEESYFVQCDEELNPPEMVERGILRSRVGINPVEPVEFHIITLENHTSQATFGT